MRLIVLTQYYPPEIGAPQARLSELAARFAAAGHEVIVLTAMPNYPRGVVYPGYGGWLRREQRDGVSIIRTAIYPTKQVGMLPRLANYFSFVCCALLVGSVLLPRADYLLTESPPLFLGIAGFILSRLKRARWIFNVSDLWPLSVMQLGVVRDGFALRCAYWLEACCYRHAWLVTGQSTGILHSIKQRFPHVPVYHLSNGVDTQRFQVGKRTQGFWAAHGIQAECVAVYVGLHGIAQGLDQLLHAAAALQQHSPLHLVFVGDGPEKARLVAQAQALANVTFLDPQPREAIPALLAAADIALVPLRQHLTGAVPSKLYEAMSVGLPVVLVANGEAAAIVQCSEAGLVVVPGDSAGLVTAIMRLAAHPAERTAMGVRGRQWVVQHVERTTLVAAFLHHLETHLRGTTH